MAIAPELGGCLGRYGKVLAVLKYVESEMELGCIASLHCAVDRYAMNSEGSWLKVAGGAKAEVLQSLTCSRQQWRGHVALELGTFVGYTAARLASAVLQALDVAAGQGQTCLVTVECDPVHVAVARHFLDLAKLASAAEVQPGMVRDAIPALGEALGQAFPRLVFMDQKGTTFHTDHAFLARLDAQPCGVGILADNVLRPGAPVYAWVLAQSMRTSRPTFWSLPEFLEESAGVEDWMALAGAAAR